MFTVHNQQQHRLGISLKTAGFIDLKTWPQSFVKFFRIAGAGSSMTIATSKGLESARDQSV